MTLALLDGDIIAYRAAYGSDQTFDWGDTGGKVAVPDAEGARETALALTEEWMRSVGATDCIVGLTGARKFRSRVLPSYNFNRKGEKPPAHAAALQALKDNFNTRLIPDLEADDVLGILATTDKYADAVVITIDKDLRTIPGRHFNPLKDKEGTIRTISEREADWWWMMQTLMGDATDGYKGCPGMGEKRAAKLILPNGGMALWWAAVVMAFKSKGLTEADAIVQARMARILRRSDYDRDTKEILLWHPTTPLRIPREDPNWCLQNIEMNPSALPGTDHPKE